MATNKTVSKRVILILAISILLTVIACDETPTPTSTLPLPPMPPDSSPMPTPHRLLPMIMVESEEYVVTVYGKVTLYEDIPLPGAEIHVNRVVNGAHFGAGVAISDMNGRYSLDVDDTEALRIWIVYPPEYKAWGIESPKGVWGLTVVNWEDPPKRCGPINFKAQWRWTPTPTMTLTPTLTPTATSTPTITLTPTSTSTPTVTPVPSNTPTPTVTPTPTIYTVGLPLPLRMTPAATELELMQQHIALGIALYNLLVTLVGAILVALAAMGYIKIKDKKA